DFSAFVPGFHLQQNQLGAIRVQAIMQEPAHLGIMISPAVFVALVTLTGQATWLIPRWQSLIVLGAAILSFSALSYAAILLALVLIALERGLLASLVGSAAAIGTGLFLYLYVPDVQLRVDDLLGLLLYPSALSANWSSLTVYNNAAVALQSLIDTNFLGGGLGSHPASFEKYSLLYGASEIPLRYAMLNNAD